MNRGSPAAGRVVSYRALPHQYELLTAEEPIVALCGGVGAGKTDGGTIWAVRQIQRTPKDGIGIIAANTYDQLLNATLRNVFKNLQGLGVPFTPTELPKSPRPLTLKIWSGSHWIEVLCRSLDNFGSLSGFEVCWYWLDEVWQTPEAAFNLVQARARDSRFRPHNQGLLTTTTDEPGSWLHKLLVGKFDPEYMRVLYATTYDNPHLPPGYVAGLLKTYSKRLAARMIDAKWVSLESGAIYHAFDRRRHEGEVSFDPALPVWWAWDFNIAADAPMSSVLLQPRKVVSPITGERRLEVRAFDELILDTTDTADTIDEFESRWLEELPEGREQVTIYGDATGRAKDTRSKTSDYGIIKSRGYKRHKVPKANPPIRTRHNTVNAVLESADGDSRFVADRRRCRTLLTGLESTKLKKGASYLEAPSREQHVTTALGYCLCVELPIKRKSASIALPF